MRDKSTLSQLLHDIIDALQNNGQTNADRLLSRLHKWMEPGRFRREAGPGFVRIDIKQPWDSTAEYALLSNIERALLDGHFVEAADQARMLLSQLQ